MSDFLRQSALILASGSINRRQLLESTGLQFEIYVAEVDEKSIKEQFVSETACQLGDRLARAKALSVSQRFPNAYVIGADQMCACENKRYDKPMTTEKAIEQLAELQGKTHQQICAMAIAHQNEIVWAAQDIAVLKMKPLHRDILKAYVAHDNPLFSCGAYHFEQMGKWLFESVEGSESSIQGLALVPLTKALSDLNIVTLL